MSNQPKDRQDSVAAGDHVFVSYSRDDRDYVNKLADWLEGHGVKIWFDHDIDYGASSRTFFLAALRSPDFNVK